VHVRYSQRGLVQLIEARRLVDPEVLDYALLIHKEEHSDDAADASPAEYDSTMLRATSSLLSRVGPIERITYVNGQIDGPYVQYGPHGALEFQGTLKYGNPCGSWIEGSERVLYPACGLEID
jgi:hypothetical protein